MNKLLENLLMTDKPSLNILKLKYNGELKDILPSIDQLFGIPQNPLHHPEIDTGIHVMQAIDASASMKHDLKKRIGVLFHDIGKGTTPKEILPRHNDHEKRGFEMATDVCQSLGIPDYFVKLVCRYHTKIHMAFVLTPKAILRLFNDTKAYENFDDFKDLLEVAHADNNGKGINPSYRDYPQKEYLLNCFDRISITNDYEKQVFLLKQINQQKFPSI